MSEEQQPFLKAQAIRLLRGTIHVLEGVVTKLETEPEKEIATVDNQENSGESASIATTDIEEQITSPELDDSTAALKSDTEVINTQTPEPPPEVPRESLVEEEPREKMPDSALPSFSAVGGWWDDILGKVRSLLPNAWSDKLSDWALTGIITGTLVAILWTSVGLLSDNEQSPKIATQPPEVKEEPAEEVPETRETPEVETQPKEEEEVRESPPRQPELTPEQGLIAAIQEQTAEITNQYAEGLVLSVEANFLGSRLTVRVSDSWYELENTRQNKIADEMLARAQELDFRKLRITDENGKLLARSPVVGSQMIVLHRQA